MRCDNYVFVCLHIPVSMAEYNYSSTQREKETARAEVREMLDRLSG